MRGNDPKRFQTNAIALEAANASSLAAREAIREHETKVHASLLTSPRRSRRVNRGGFRPLAAKGSNI